MATRRCSTVRVLLVAATTVLALAVGLLARPTTASASLVGFDAGNIISNGVFFNSGSMTAAQIDAFLDAKGASCRPGDMPCLKDYRQTTWDQPKDTICPGGYTGAANETAGAIIAKAAQGCGINPQVLIVMLQKEQSLITMTQPGVSRYNKAMGFGCPDSTGCNANYYGFFTQVYKGARQFQIYTHNPRQYNYWAGQTNQILYHPNTACGRKPVYIANQATANLYIYTPYTPNAAALAANFGTGDKCSSYGNRNFYNYFTTWFGSTQANLPPVGQLDKVEATADTIEVAGWSYDPDNAQPVEVLVSLDGSITTLTASQHRDLPGRSGPAGFSTTLTAAAGDHSVCVSARDTTNAQTSFGCWVVSVAPRVAPASSTSGLVVTATTRVFDTWSSDMGATNRCFSVQSAGVPTQASGVLLNVAAVSPVGPGNVVVYPEGYARPQASSVNFEPGREVADAAWVSVGPGGRVCLATQGAGPGRIVIDVSGYALDDSPVVTQVPTRLMDTRASSRVGTQGPIPARQVVDVMVAGRVGVPADAKAVAMTATAVLPASVGHLRIYPAGSTEPPDIATVNYAPGQTKANAVVVGLTGGKVSLYSDTSAGPVEVVLDVTGYVPASGDGYVPVAPTRVLDTRSSAPSSLRALSTLSVGTVSLDARRLGVVPTAAKAVVINATAVGPTGVGNLTVHSPGSVPSGSSLNYIPGRDVPNLVVVPIGADGMIALTNDQNGANSTNLTLDVVGYLK